MKRAIPDKAAKVKQAGERALREAREREALARREAAKSSAPAPRGLAKELGGRDGPEPTRFGDWERKGIATDF